MSTNNEQRLSGWVRDWNNDLPYTERVNYGQYEEAVDEYERYEDPVAAMRKLGYEISAEDEAIINGTPLPSEEEAVPDVPDTQTVPSVEDAAVAEGNDAVATWQVRRLVQPRVRDDIIAVDEGSLTQAEIAERDGVTQQAVSKRLSAVMEATAEGLRLFGLGLPIPRPTWDEVRERALAEQKARGRAADLRIARSQAQR